MTWMPARRRSIWRGGRGGNEAMKEKKPINMPRFTSDEEEANWWASRQGRDFVKQASAGTPEKGMAPKGSRLVGQLNRTSSVQIALRLPEPDVAKARELAIRRGIGYQTLLKMLVHEGLQREARRA
jgi:hypothetical protein